MCCIISRINDTCSLLRFGLRSFCFLENWDTLTYVVQRRLSPKEAVAYPLPKHLLFGWCSSLVQLLKEAMADPIHVYCQQEKNDMVFV